jgi:DNA-binding NarL/FixJ family response regulator
MRRFTFLSFLCLPAGRLARAALPGGGLALPAAAVVARRLRALGEQGVRRGPRPATAANPAGLTHREAQVLRLMTAGQSNTEIAARLVLSGRTVDNHVSAILRKLGVRTRGEAAAQAERLSLGADPRRRLVAAPVPAQTSGQPAATRHPPT